MFHAPVKWSRVEETHKHVIILASGPSVSSLNMELLRKAQTAGCYVIAINGAIDSYPLADAWFTLDPHTLGPRTAHITAHKYVAIPEDFGIPNSRFAALRDPPPSGIDYLHRIPDNGPLNCKYGLSEDPACIYTGNSAYGALGIAYLMGARYIALLGVDGTHGYFYDPAHTSGNLSHLPELFASTVPQFERAGVVVWNGSPNSIVQCFERTTPDQAVSNIINMMDDITEAPTPAPLPTPSPTSPNAVNHFVCVLRSGGAYNARYVNNLYNAVLRHTRTPITFSVITDAPSGLNPAINIIPFTHQWPTWWSKLEMFRPNIWKGGRVWYMDLDTIIVGEITSMVQSPHLGDNFVTLNDPIQPGRLASGVMSWMANDPEATSIYETFRSNASNIMQSCGSLGDQCWVGAVLKSRVFLQDLFPNKVVSFKRNCFDGRCVGEASIVYFHGKPRPHEVIGKPETTWVQRHWR